MTVRSSPLAGIEVGELGFRNCNPSFAPIPRWSGRGEKLIKIGAKVVSHGRYVTFQLAEVAVSRQMFQEILSLIARLRASPAPA
jgi:hypothetical protein